VSCAINLFDLLPNGIRLWFSTSFLVELRQRFHEPLLVANARHFQSVFQDLFCLLYGFVTTRGKRPVALRPSDPSRAPLRLILQPATEEFLALFVIA
jgi:hypothetical protein